MVASSVECHGVKQALVAQLRTLLCQAYVTCG